MKVSDALFSPPKSWTFAVKCCIFVSLVGVSFYQYLEHIPVPHVEMNKCNSTEHYNGLLDDSHICSGARADRPTCKGDTGAPLMCLDEAGSWKLVGILSREGECLAKSHPDVFTSTVNWNDWIAKTIGRKMP